MNRKIRVGFVCLFFVIQIGWGQESEILPDLRQRVETVSDELTTPKPHYMDPLAFNATVVWSNDKSQLAVIIKAYLLDGWHTYAYVPETKPYISSELKLILPRGITVIGDWELPPAAAYEGGIYIYRDELVFVQYCSVSGISEGDLINAGLYYQTCDIHKCFPPVTKAKELSL